MHAPLLWIDIETTGLDEHTSRMLEVGMILTDGDLNEVASVEVVLGWRDPHGMPMPDVVREMHTRSGLLDEAAQSRMCLREAEDLEQQVQSLHAEISSSASTHVADGRDRSRRLDELLGRARRVRERLCDTRQELARIERHLARERRLQLNVPPVEMHHE